MSGDTNTPSPRSQMSAFYVDHLPSFKNGPAESLTALQNPSRLGSLPVYASPSPQMSVVKPLAWEAREGRHENGNTGRLIVATGRHPYGAYFIEQDANGSFFVLPSSALADLDGIFGSEASAKRSAQEEHEKRIHSALAAEVEG